MERRLPEPCLVVLVGPSGSGKTTWAHEHFAANEVVSSDALRALAGEDEYDQRASADAFALLAEIVERRLRRGLVTVVDTLGFDQELRRAWTALAAGLAIPAFAVRFDTPPVVCRERNRSRVRPVPARVLDRQIRRMRDIDLSGDGFTEILAPAPVAAVSPAHVATAPAAEAQRRSPGGLRFDLHLSAFPWQGHDVAQHLGRVARDAEEAGFQGIWVMDHFRQIPQVGPAWHDMLESHTTIAYLAGVTTTVRLGVLVSGVTYRNPAHLGKIVATADVLSGGRVVCGLGAAWFEAEHRAYGWRFPPASERLDLLEDTLRLLPLLWGPGSPSFTGKVIEVPEAMCYPRPLQERVPIVVGGGGERRTLRLVAELADGCNLLGDAETVARKVEVLRDHARAVERDPTDIEVTHLGTVLVADDRTGLRAAVDRLRPRGAIRAAFAARVNAGRVDDHVGRFRTLVEAGVETAIVSLADVAEPGAIERFAGVIAAFRDGSAGDAGGLA